jgi:VWFA-related protein
MRGSPILMKDPTAFTSLLPRTLTAIFCALLPVSALPQEQRTPAFDAYTLHQRVEEVMLYCTVTDHAGQQVTTLAPSDFHVFEDKKPAHVLHVKQEDVPISLSLVLDGSASMQDKRPAVNTAALDLIAASNPSDETSLTNFADTAYLDQDFTQNRDALRNALSANQSVSGGTALFDTIIRTADHLSEKGTHSKQVIVVVTDGNDNASTADLQAAIKRVRHTDGPMVYAVGLLYNLPSATAARSRKELRSLADETGGVSYFPSSLNDVDTIAKEVAKDIRSQYSIAFRPVSKEDVDVYHAVSVQASSPTMHGLIVRTRKGFIRSPHATPASYK